MLELISLEEANQILLNKSKTSGMEVVSLRNALGRVLAENIMANINVPPFDRSAVDGYGICSKASDSIQFKVEGEIPAGHSYMGQVNEGRGVRIFTGAPVPKGITAVIRQEDVTVQGENIIIQKPWKQGDNIALCGEDTREGELLINKGALITPAHIGLLASQGYDKVTIFNRPIVGVFSTGDELIFPGEKLTPGKIYNSNLYSIVALVEDLGAEAHDFGIVSDSLEKTSLAIKNALEKVDILVTTGGVSVGDYDILKEAIELIGGQLLFWKVSIKPGTPIVVGTYNEKLIIGLSGNPAASLIGAELFLAPVIRKMLGHPQVKLKRIAAVASGEVSKPDPNRRMLRVNIQESTNPVIAKISDRQKAGIFMSLVGSNGVIDLLPNELIREGQDCKVILFNTWE